MNKIAIVYASLHHGNTAKLVRGIADMLDITLFDAVHSCKADLSGYDVIGFASGIDFGRFYDCAEKFLEENLPENKKVFFLYTCARESKRFTQTIQDKALKKRAIILGEFGCKGYNTYGPWKLIGGMNKNHPAEEEIQFAVEFVRSCM